MTHTPTLAERAQALRQQQSPAAQAVIDLVKAFKAQDDFTPARELLDQLRPCLAGEAEEVRITLAQLHSLCTYKDSNLPAEQRYRQALALLAEIGLHSPRCYDSETLGQGGAIYKRLWEHTGLIEHLHTALAFYRAGWERDAAHDLGWCGVNAAYVLDLLAFREQTAAQRAGVQSILAQEWQEQARALRLELRERVPGLLTQAGEDEGYWGLATRAEIHFGLRDYEQAGKYLAQAKAANPDNWKHYTAAQQLVNLARLHRIPFPSNNSQADQHPAWAALRELLGENTDAVIAGQRGKVGLALSGGGFRAALFHLGMLARLAECDVLRSVETLSTVSGGSIVGAHYYLELRQLLQEKPDAELTREDYLALVQRLMTASLAGIQKNLRVRVLGNLVTNLKMAFASGYSRSMRLGELYEEHLFNQVRDEHSNSLPQGFWCRLLLRTPLRRLRHLLISPARSEAAATPTDFKPRKNNWLRQAKVPNLMLNSTSLNSGHNWHFTARWMGEPPGLTGDEIDMTDRYRRLYYSEAPTGKLRNYPLAYAVAASSCVPALFEPLPLEGLYPGRTVRLVDGGVHDNQGIGGLLDDECNFILCSDASGQLNSEADPANGMLGVFWRSDSIFQERLRQTQYRDVHHRAEAGALQGLFFIHLKQGLETAPIDWIDSNGSHYRPPVQACTAYGVDKEIQRLLAEIRTDLDSFSEVEAYALMASGYLMTTHQLQELNRQHQDAGLPGTWGGFAVDAPASTDPWPFAGILPLMGLPPDSSDLRRQDLVTQLRAGSIMFFRVWHLVSWLRYGAYAAGAATVTAGLCWLIRHWGETISLPWLASLRVDSLTITLWLLLAGMLFPAFKYLNPRTADQNLLLTVSAGVIGWLGSLVHLRLLEPLFQWRGSLQRLLQLKP